MRLSAISLPVLITASLGVMVAATSVVAIAGPASNSPFASKKKKAWETAPTQVPMQAPTSQSYQAPQYQAPQYQPAPQPYTQSSQPYQQQNQYGVAQKLTASGQSLQNNTPAIADGSSAQPLYNTAQHNTAQPAYLPSANYGAQNRPTNSSLAGGQYQPNAQNQNWSQTPSWAQQQTRQGYQQGAQNAANPYGNYQQGYAQKGYGNETRQIRNPAIKQPWYQKLGLGNFKTDISGKAKAGVAYVDGASRSGDVEFIADLDVRAEISTLTQGGLEYGAGLRGRAQRDRHRRGFGGRIGDCPASNINCASALVDGNTRAIKGHTSGFHTAGTTDSDDYNTSLEGAYVFLRSAYGDVVLGRDDGAAYLFSLGAPSLVAVGGSNSGVDYTGLDSVKTVNDASGFAEKISYTSPRLLGDQVGVGVQVGFSYAPNARACGVDYCVVKNTSTLTDIFAPDMKDIFEVGLSLDRKFNSGVSAELTATYARGSEDSGNAAFDDLSAFGLGLELKYKNLVFGTSWLNSNNGIAQDGNYSAYDVGLTWQPSNLGFSASYGHAKDDLVNMTSDQAVLAMSYDFGDKETSKFRLGTGLQYVNRKSPYIEAGTVTQHSEDALALFIEGRMKF